MGEKEQKTEGLQKKLLKINLYYIIHILKISEKTKIQPKCYLS